MREEHKFYKSFTSLFEPRLSKYESQEFKTTKENFIIKKPNEKSNIFFVETNTQHEFFTSKQQCAIESAAFHNPNLNVYVYSLNADFENKKIFDYYTNIFLYKFIPKEIFANTPLWDWWLSGKVFNSTYMIAHLSDAARLALLWKYGGFYSVIFFLVL